MECICVETANLFAIEYTIELPTPFIFLFSIAQIEREKKNSFIHMENYISIELFGRIYYIQFARLTFARESCCWQAIHRIIFEQKTDFWQIIWISSLLLCQNNVKEETNLNERFHGKFFWEWIQKAKHNITIEVRKKKSTLHSNWLFLISSEANWSKSIVTRSNMFLIDYCA